MKIATKTISIIMALTLLLSVCLLPSYAVSSDPGKNADDYKMEVKYTLSQDTDNSDDTYDVYKLRVSVKAGNYALNMLGIPVIFDKTIFQPASAKSDGFANIRYTTAPAGQWKFPAAVKLGELADEENMYLEDGVTVDPDNGSIAPSSGNIIQIFQYSAFATSNFGTLDQSKYGGVYFYFEFNDSCRYIIAKNEYVDLVDLIFFTPKGTNVSGAEFGTIGDSTKPSGSVDESGQLYSASGIGELGLQSDPSATEGCIVHSLPGATPPVVTAPVVTKDVAQVKYQGANPTEAQNNDYDFRIISKISDTDWDNHFSNTEAGAGNSRITKVGMVAYTGTTATFDMDTAKAVAAGTPTADYHVSTTDYICKDGDSDATFGAMLLLNNNTLPNDITYVGFVQYIDATGATAYAYYEAQQTALLKSNFTTYVNAFFAA